MRLAIISKQQDGEPFWHVQVALLAAIGLQLLLSPDLVFGSKYVMAGVELILLAVISLGLFGHRAQRILAFFFIFVVALANIISLGLVVHQLLYSGNVTGTELLISAFAIYLVNIILFGFLYWELDGNRPEEPDFEFPQFTAPKHQKWHPTFFDYLYVSMTNGTAFSPTDTMPFTHRAKLFMSIQALISLITVVLVTARAVNIIG
jgi:uncharacterized membrane protein